MGARYYNPFRGRFTQADPSGQSANRYAYVGCNPINATDPTGLNSSPACIQSGGLTAALGVGAAGFGIGALVATGTIFGAPAGAVLGAAAVATTAAAAVSGVFTFLNCL
jgi:uncharacterized protein RhaS with RHS repeats